MRSEEQVKDTEPEGAFLASKGELFHWAVIVPHFAPWFF
jgi:hypothetical protein